MNKIMELAEAYRASHRCIADFAETNGDKERAALQAEVTRMEQEIQEAQTLKNLLFVCLQERAELRAKLAALEAQEPVMMGVMSTRDGSLMNKVAVKNWFTFPKELAELEAELWVVNGAAKIVPLYLAAGAKP